MCNERCAKAGARLLLRGGDGVRWDQGLEPLVFVFVKPDSGPHGILASVPFSCTQQAMYATQGNCRWRWIDTCIPAQTDTHEVSPSDGKRDDNGGEGKSESKSEQEEIWTIASLVVERREKPATHIVKVFMDPQDGADHRDVVWMVPVRHVFERENFGAGWD